MNSLPVLVVLCILVPFSHAQTMPGPAGVASTSATRPRAPAKVNVPGMEDFNRDEPVVTTPKLLKQVYPEFPKQARKDQFSGTVNVTMTVDAAGKPQDVHVDAPVGHGCDKAAMKAVRQYRFEPARLDGKPVAVTLHVEVAFQLY
jgi:TonB family protein